MKQLAIRLGHQKTMDKSLVMTRGGREGLGLSIKCSKACGQKQTPSNSPLSGGERNANCAIDLIGVSLGIVKRESKVSEKGIKGIGVDFFSS
jgi:hypothetical protein